MISHMLVFASLVHATCTHRSSCSHNGECSPVGTCSCTSAWTGEYCEKLRLLPGRRSLGYQGKDVDGSLLSSWGGAPLRADDGTYHMLVSEMANGAGLLPWACNSRVIHATSDDPLTQPFVKRRELFGLFSHEPRCTRAPAGGPFVCLFSHNPDYHLLPHAAACHGNGHGSSLLSCNCNNGGPKPTYMTHTTDLNGNWSLPVLVANVSCDANVSPYIFANGSLLALYRNNIGSNIHLLTAADWRDPGSYKLGTANLPGGLFLPEDPFLWRDAHGVFHSLQHNYPWPAGPHAWSLDGYTWQLAPNHALDAYGPNATFVDAPLISGGCRERPSLIFAADGTTPIALVNGFSPNPSKVGATPSGSCRYSGIDYSFTLIQPIATEQVELEASPSY